MTVQSIAEVPVKRFRLNTGRYVQDHPTERIREGGISWPAEQIFVQGQVIETTEDLERFNSLGAGGPKFTKLDDPVEPDTIESLEAKLAALKTQQIQRSFDEANGGKTMNGDESDVQKAARQGFDTAFTDSAREPPKAIIPDMPSPNPGNKVPEPSSSQERGRTKVPLARLHAMSVKQLQDLAAEEEIDVKGATQKDALIRIMTRG